MSKISAIIENSVRKFDQNWYNQKKMEFESSELFIPETNCLKINNENVYGEIQSSEDLEYDLSLCEYCLLDQRDFNNFMAYLTHSIKNPIKKMPIIDEEAFNLAEDLFHNIQKIEIIHCNEILQSILAQVEVACNSINIEEDSVYSLVLNEFHSSVRLYLNNMLIERLELQNYIRPVDEKLIFNLNTEDFTAFMRILLTSKIITESEEKLADISAKYFLYKPNGKPLTFLPSIRFKEEIDSHSNPSHKGKGVMNIKNKIAKGISLIEKLRDEVEDTRAISKKKK